MDNVLLMIGYLCELLKAEKVKLLLFWETKGEL